MRIKLLSHFREPPRMAKEEGGEGGIKINWNIRKLYPDETLEWMSPERFLARVPHPLTTLYPAVVGINNVSIEKGGKGYDTGSLRSIYDRILEGREIDALYLDYKNMWHGYPGHEGRHRAVVCSKLKIEKVPVIVRRARPPRVVDMPLFVQSKR